MRIALTSPYCWPEVRRGGERYVHELAAALQASGHHVTVWSMAGPPRHDRQLGVEVRRLPPHSLLRRRFADQSMEVGLAARLLPRLAASAVDVWHANGIADGAAATLAGRLRHGVRTVFTDHGFPVAASKAKRADAGLHRRITADIDAYVCVSQAAGEWLRRDFGREPTVIPPGIDLAAYSPADQRDRRPTVLFVGQLDESRKNLSLLLEAVGLLLPTIPKLQVWLAGQGTARAALDSAGDEIRAAVTHCGAVDEAELRRRYAAAWVTAHPAVAESFGMVVIESLASGTPVVVRRDSGGPAEIVTSPDIGVQCGETAADLAEGIRRTLDLGARAGAAAACRGAAEPFDWRTGVVPRLEQVYAGHG